MIGVIWCCCCGLCWWLMVKMKKMSRCIFCALVRSGGSGAARFGSGTVVAIGMTTSHGAASDGGADTSSGMAGSGAADGVDAGAVIGTANEGSTGLAAISGAAAQIVADAIAVAATGEAET